MMTRTLHAGSPIALALVLAGCATHSNRLATSTAQELNGKRLLTLEQLYDPEKKLDFNGKPPAGLVWLDDEHYLWSRADPETKRRIAAPMRAAASASSSSSRT